MNKTWFLPAALAVVLCSCCFSQTAQQNDEEFTLVSYNLRTGGKDGKVDLETNNDWGKRLPRVITMFNRMQPDIVGTQEPYDYQLKDLLEATGYKSIGIARNGKPEGDEFSAIVYNPKRFKVMKDGTFWLSETPDVFSKGWDAAYPRIATWGIFEDLKTGKKFIMYNTHLDHRGEKARQESIKIIVKHARENAGALPLILTGDLNAKPGSPTIKTAEELLTDSRKISETPPEGPQDYSFTGYRKDEDITNRKGPIDFIFVSEGVKVLSHQTDDFRPDGKFASDHLPLMARLRLK